MVVLDGLIFGARYDNGSFAKLMFDSGFTDRKMAAGDNEL